MKIKKMMLMALGCVGVALGAVGAVVPLVPAFPFLLLAAVCFAKSSQRLSRWFTATGLYQKHLASYVRGEGMTRQTKLRIMLLVTLLLSIGFVMMDSVPVGRVALVVIWLIHVCYFTFGVKTISILP